MFDRGKPLVKRFMKDQDRIKLTAATDSVEMDELIWKELPEDLFEAIISRLPVASFFRSRSVCCKWDSLPTSQSFSQLCAEVKCGQPWFYSFSHEKVNTAAMFDPALQKWYHLTVPGPQNNLNLLPLASAGGLVCSFDVGNKSFHVCNPLTKSFRVLPPRSTEVWSRIAVGMTMNETLPSGGYKILWVCCDGEYEVYDSKLNSWAQPGSMPSSIKLPLSLKYRDLKQFIIPVPQDLRDHTLAECEGKILLMGLLTKNAATSVCIWELEKTTLLWREVDIMPGILRWEFYQRFTRMTCLGNIGLFMLLLKARRMYDVTEREWQKLPSCVRPIGTIEEWITGGTAFHPCLTNYA